MANETTTTSWTSQILSEALGPVAIPAHLPKMVVAPLCNQDSIDGLSTLTKQYAVDSDLGAASALTEGTDLSANTALGMGTAITVTPTEAAGVKSTITGRAVKRRFPGFPADAVFDAIQSQDVARFVQLVGPQARRQAKMAMEKAEDDVCNLLSGGSNTVGTSGADLTVSVAVSAIYTLKTLEPASEDWAFVWTPNQLLELQLELGVAGGGLGGGVWFQQGDLSFFNHRPDVSQNGFRGSFLGVPIFEYSHSLRTTMNSGADVAGALMVIGQGPPDELDSVAGALVFCEGENGIRFLLQNDASMRGAELVCVYEYATAELDDSNIVTIVSDAP